MKDFQFNCYFKTVVVIFLHGEGLSVTESQQCFFFYQFLGFFFVFLSPLRSVGIPGGEMFAVQWQHKFE